MELSELAEHIIPCTALGSARFHDPPRIQQGTQRKGHSHLEGPDLKLTIGGVASIQMSNSAVWFTRPPWSVARSVSP